MGMSEDIIIFLNNSSIRIWQRWKRIWIRAAWRWSRHTSLFSECTWTTWTNSVLKLDSSIDFETGKSLFSSPDGRKVTDINFGIIFGSNGFHRFCWFQQIFWNMPATRRTSRRLSSLPPPVSEATKVLPLPASARKTKRQMLEVSIPEEEEFTPSNGFDFDIPSPKGVMTRWSLLFWWLILKLKLILKL